MASGRRYFFLLKGGSRSRALLDASKQGLSKVGTPLPNNRRWDSRFFYDVVIGYSWLYCNGAFQAHKAKGRKYVYLDLGYWNRRPPGYHWTGYHKFAINGFHPDEYFRLGNPDDRFREQRIKIRPWDGSGRAIVVIGTTVKAAQVMGKQFQSWEKEIIQEIRKYSDRKIIYRAKPNAVEAQPIPGTVWSQTEPLDAVFRKAHIVVMHHSNAAVDAMVYGVPIYCEEGVGRHVSIKHIRDIENPYIPDDRHEFLHDVAYCQWNCDEISQGLPWRYYRDKGLLP